MDLRVIFLCFVTVYGKTPEHNPYYKPILGFEPRDARGQASTVKSGFVQPLDFSTFTEQFVGEQKDGQGLGFGHVKAASDFGAEPKTAGAFQIPTSEFSPFQGLIFQGKDNKTGFAQTLQFESSFNKAANTKVYKTNINPSQKGGESDTNDQISKATEDREGDSYFNPSKVQSYRRPARPKTSHSYGKSSYPSPNRRSSPSNYQSDVVSPEDVEMILPKDKVLFLPMINGKPKPYDGYRAAAEISYENLDEAKERSRLREKRLNEGEIIYGKPKNALSELYHRHLKRSPAEYYGGIYPYYDYSDAKLSVGGDTDPDTVTRGKKSATSSQKGKKSYPKKHVQGNREKPYNLYKHPKDSPKRRNKDDGTLGYESGEDSEETEDSLNEDTEETKGGKPLYKYTYDDTVRVPPLEIKTYPYEKHLRDSDVEGSKRDESYDYDDNVDEYTAGYESYIKSLPSDLETYFGSAEVNERFSVEATENLENNKNCRKIDNPPAKTEEGAEEAKKESDAAGTQICYVCSDPKTGDNYEQCAYRSQPKSEKYFFGGSTSFKTNETAEPTTYRYRRSTFDHPPYPYALLGSESVDNKQYEGQEDMEEEIYKRPKKKYKKKYKKQGELAPYEKKQPKKRYGEYNPFFKLQGAYSTKRGRAAKSEEPPRSYDGPKYTYEGPEETYEGPSQPYEGPKETYEGPAEPYEGPINQEYYDTVDERIQDDEEQESQSSSPYKSSYYNEGERQKPKKRQSYSSFFGNPYTSPTNYERDYSYRPHGGYTSDYRFGPEHFVDEGESEDTKHTQQVKPIAAPKSEKRGPQKFQGSEARSAAATDKQEKEEPIGEVKTFKNGDVCQKKRKEGMICMVCKNEKTAATYEQCQYSTKPKEKYYAFGSQKSYTTRNPDAGPKEDESESGSDSDQFPEKSDIVEKKILITTQSKVFGYDPIPTEGLAVAESKNSPLILSSDLYGEYADNVETHPEEQSKKNDTSRDFKESIERIQPRDGIEGLEEYLYDAEDNEKKATEDEKQSYKTYDEYFRDLFPEFAKTSEPIPESDEKEESESEAHLAFDPFSNVRKFHEENNNPEQYATDEEEEEEKDAEASRPEELRLKDRESRIPREFFVPYNEEEHKKDLEKALGEFQNRDWSNCKKIVKKKLTCYQCVDENGVNNEECMYVEASQPISKHLAYHEKKEFRPSAQEIKNKTVEPTPEITQPEKGEKALRRFRKAKNSPEEVIEVVETPKDAEYMGEDSAKKGDFEGVENFLVKTYEDMSLNEGREGVPEQNTLKPKVKKNKRNPKKRNKTIRNETTTERFEKIRKRKFPLKKFTDNEEPMTDNKPDDGSFGLKNSEHIPGTVNLNETTTR